jgi:hypothetical protein
MTTLIMMTLIISPGGSIGSDVEARLRGVGFQVPDIIQIQLLAVLKCASDSSPYVRRCAATAIPKIYTLDPSQLPQLVQVRYIAFALWWLGQWLGGESGLG